MEIEAKKMFSTIHYLAPIAGGFSAEISLGSLPYVTTSLARSQLLGLAALGGLGGILPGVLGRNTSQPLTCKKVAILALKHLAATGVSCLTSSLMTYYLLKE